jgi:hypothetical protein
MFTKPALANLRQSEGPPRMRPARVPAGSLHAQSRNTLPKQTAKSPSNTCFVPPSYRNGGVVVLRSLRTTCDFAAAGRYTSGIFSILENLFKQTQVEGFVQ